MGFKANIRHIVISTKKKHFPKLRRTWIVFENSTDYYMAITMLPFNFSILFVDKICKKLSNDALQALVVHEFCHFTANDEREVDSQVVKLGFGTGLLAFHKQHNKKYKRYKKNEGLTAKEIEKLIHE